MNQKITLTAVIFTLAIAINLHAQPATPPQSVHDAITAGNLDAVKQLLQNGADPNARDGQNRSALLLAIKAKNRLLAELLIDHGADINAQDNNGYTLLHGAAFHGDLAAVQLALTLAADPNIKNAQGLTPLHLAFQNNHPDILQLLIRHKADFKSSLNFDGVAALLNPPDGILIETTDSLSLLHIAAVNNQKDIVKILLSAGIDPNIKDNQGDTPLHLLAVSKSQNIEIAQLLIDGKANIEALDNDGYRPLYLAVCVDNTIMAKWLIEHGANVNASNSNQMKPLQQALIRNNQIITELLKKHGAYEFCTPDPKKPDFIINPQNLKAIESCLANDGNVNIRDENGNTPLHWAADKDKEKIVELLLAHNADVNAMNRFNESPLIRSVTAPTIVKMLLDAGANVNAADDDLWTPLHHAVNSGIYSTVVLLMEHGAQINALDSLGVSPLFESINNAGNRQDCLNCARLLIDKGADVNQKNIAGLTPLHRAAEDGYIDIVEILIENKAEVNAKDRKGQTPLHVLSFGPSDEIAQILIDHGADPTLADNEGMTPIDYAKEMGNKNRVNILTKGSTPVEQKQNENENHNLTREEFRQNYRSYLQAYILNQWLAHSQNPLHQAVVKGDYNTVKTLIENGADINAVDLNPVDPPGVMTMGDPFNRHVTPLHCAVYFDQQEILNLLLEKGADPLIGDVTGKTPLHYAVEKNLIELAQCLIDHGVSVNLPNTKNGQPPIFYAIHYDQIDMFNFLLERGANLNACDKEQSTLMHYVAYFGNIHTEHYLNLISSLINKGFDVNQTNKMGETPLHNAVSQSDNDKMVEFLVQQGANINIVNEEGNPPLFGAIEGGHIKSIQVLLENDADVNITNQNNENALFFLWEDHWEIADLLIKKGININQMNIYKNTPLHAAAERGFMETTTLLMNAGADINSKNEDGTTPLQNADPAVAELLKKHGAVDQ